MVVGIVTNEKKDPGLAYTQQVCEFLTQRGVAAYSGLVGACPGLDPEEFPTNAKFLVVLGGDGTMLRCSHIAARHDIPLLGINLGTLGFLTDVEKTGGLTAIEKVLAGEYRTEKRMMLTTDCTPENPIALNDICIGTVGGLKYFFVYVNGQPMGTTRADGIIVSTPTGSTAYNVAAGGPILMPCGQMMVITPICPHSLSSRPLVVGAEDIVRITPHQKSQIFIDGDNIGEMERDITIRKSSYETTIIKTLT